MKPKPVGDPEHVAPPYGDCPQIVLSWWGMMSTVFLMVAMLCLVPWGYGSCRKQGGTLARSVPQVSVGQGTGQGVVNQGAELAALDRRAPPPWTGDDRQNAQALFVRLQECGIAVKPTFYRMLGLASPAQRSDLVRCCRVFFDNVDPQEVASTCCLTSMVQRKRQVESFLSHSDSFIRRVARTQALKSMTSLFNGRGFPKAEEDIQAFIEWEVWWQQGEGTARLLDRKLLGTFTAMFNGKGLPDKKAVEDYLKWDIWWQGEGKARSLDRELLCIFSSMFSGKGLPDKKTVGDYLQLDNWWKSDGETRLLDRELLHIFSSMFHGRGLPDKKAVADYYQWDIWWRGEGETRTLDRELLRTFSSMFNSKGLPEKQSVDNCLNWELWWQGEGEARTLDRGLLRIFFSMFGPKGFPDKKRVDDYLNWELWWQGEGEARTLDRELLRTFSAMFCNKGLPDSRVVEDYLQWDVWWQGGGHGRTLDRELLRIFSSMFYRKGLPDKKAVEDYLKWDVWWQGEGRGRILDRELLRSFSSMFYRKGLPDKRAVDDYLQLDVWWQGEGEVRKLDRKLLHAISSMFCGKGLPDKKAVGDYLQWQVWWQGEGDGRTLDRGLLRTFAWVYRHRGLPDKKAVEDYLQLDVWWQGRGGLLDRELLRTFFAMFHSRGLPDKKVVEDFLQWDVWWQGDGETRTLDRQRLRAFSLMFKGKGLPDKPRTNEVLQWLTGDKQWDRQAIKVMADLYFAVSFGQKSLGLPDVNKLRQTAQKLTALIGSGEGDQDPESDVLPLIKMVVLYLANDGGIRQLHWADCDAWLREHPGALSKWSLLRRLLFILHHHGGQGVKEAVSLISGQPVATQWFVLNSLVSGHALTSVRYALEAIAPTDWWEYLFFTEEFQSVPSNQQWQTIKGYLEVLAPVLSNGEYLRRFLALIWSFSAADRERFIQPDAVVKLTTLMPSAQVMGKFSKSLSKNELRTLFDTCLAEPYMRECPSISAWLKEYVDGDGDSLVPENLQAFLSECDQLSQGCAVHAHDDPPAVWQEAVLRQSVLGEADIDQLYAYRDQLTMDHVIDILLRMDQRVSPDVARRWQLLLNERQQQVLNISAPSSD